MTAQVRKKIESPTVLESPRKLPNGFAPTRWMVLGGVAVWVSLILSAGCYSNEGTTEPAGSPIESSSGAPVTSNPKQSELSSDMEDSQLTMTDGHETSILPPPQDTKPSAGLEDLFLFYPSRYPLGDWMSKPSEALDCWFTSEDGTKLHGWFCPVPQSRGTILYCHGNGGNLSDRTPLIRRLNELSCNVFIFDYRGYGRSEGLPTVSGAVQDAKAARKQLAKLAATTPDQLILMGRSLGGAIAAELAAEQPAEALILESTFSSLRQLGLEKTSWGVLIPEQRLNTGLALTRFSGPLLLSHGTHDELIPYHHAEDLRASVTRGSRQMLQFFEGQGLGHNDPLPAEYYDQLSLFLDRIRENPDQT